MQTGDTIAAVASAVGQGARMIVRLSGPQALQLASHLASPPDAPVSFTRLRIDDVQVCGWIYIFLAPRSYTGEETIEFHLPGNPLLARMALDELIRLGARHADPGEFTARAYFNGRIDLSQAEGVASIIAANGESELRAARQLLAGELARRVKPALDSLAEMLALVEVGIDFSEEDVAILSPEKIVERLNAIEQILDRLMQDSPRLERLHHTPQFVLIGRPNAGKSTLLNAMAGEDRAVVSPQAGTTRDALSADVMVDRGMIRIIDVAGLEEVSTSAVDDEISRQMHQRALSQLDSADFVILVRDVTDPRHAFPTHRVPDIRIASKIDLIPAGTLEIPEHENSLSVSAHTGENLPVLIRRLDELAFGSNASGILALNARHLAAIADTRAALSRAREQADRGAELLAAELRDALDALGAIVGRVTPDDVLGRVFSAFCIGK